MYNEIPHGNSLASFKYNKILRTKKKYKSWKREKIIKEYRYVNLACKYN